MSSISEENNSDRHMEDPDPDGFDYDKDTRSESFQKSRQKNLTDFEKAFVIELVKQDIDVIESKTTDFGSIRKKRDAWDRIAAKFNSETGNTYRTTDQLKKFWDNQKTSAKSAVAKRKRLIRKTGGGEPVKRVPDNLERIVSMIPAQMNPLENAFDSDAGWHLDEPSGQDPGDAATTDTTIALIETNLTTKASGSTDDSTSGKRRSKDPRSSLVDMEDEEHKLRLKILATEYETAQLKKKTAAVELKKMEDEYKMWKQNNVIEVVSVE